MADFIEEEIIDDEEAEANDNYADEDYNDDSNNEDNEDDYGEEDFERDAAPQQRLQPNNVVVGNAEEPDEEEVMDENYSSDADAVGEVEHGEDQEAREDADDDYGEEEFDAPVPAAVPPEHPQEPPEATAAEDYDDDFDAGAPPPKQKQEDPSPPPAAFADNAQVEDPTRGNPPTRRGNAARRLQQLQEKEVIPSPPRIREVVPEPPPIPPETREMQPTAQGANAAPGEPEAVAAQAEPVHGTGAESPALSPAAVPAVQPEPDSHPNSPTPNVALSGAGNQMNQLERNEAADSEKEGEMKALAAAVEKDTNSPEAWAHLGEALGVTETIDVNGRSVGKKECCVEVLQHEPTNNVAWRTLGAVLSRGESVEVSGKSYTKQDCLNMASDQSAILIVDEAEEHPSRRVQKRSTPTEEAHAVPDADDDEAEEYLNLEQEEEEEEEEHPFRREQERSTPTEETHAALPLRDNEAEEHPSLRVQKLAHVAEETQPTAQEADAAPAEPEAAAAQAEPAHGTGAESPALSPAAVPAVQPEPDSHPNSPTPDVADNQRNAEGGLTEMQLVFPQEEHGEGVPGSTEDAFLEDLDEPPAELNPDTIAATDSPTTTLTELITSLHQAVQSYADALSYSHAEGRPLTTDFPKSRALQQVANFLDADPPVEVLRDVLFGFHYEVNLGQQEQNISSVELLRLMVAPNCEGLDNELSQSSSFALQIPPEDALSRIVDMLFVPAVTSQTLETILALFAIVSADEGASEMATQPQSHRDWALQLCSQVGTVPIGIQLLRVLTPHLSVHPSEVSTFLLEILSRLCQTVRGTPTEILILNGVVGAVLSAAQGVDGVASLALVDASFAFLRGLVDVLIPLSQHLCSPKRSEKAEESDVTAIALSRDITAFGRIVLSAIVRVTYDTSLKDSPESDGIFMALCSLARHRSLNSPRELDSWLDALDTVIAEALLNVNSPLSVLHFGAARYLTEHPMEALQLMAWFLTSQRQRNPEAPLFAFESFLYALCGRVDGWPSECKVMLLSQLGHKWLTNECIVTFNACESSVQLLNEVKAVATSVESCRRSCARAAQRLLGKLQPLVQQFLGRHGTEENVVQIIWKEPDETDANKADQTFLLFGSLFEIVTTISASRLLPLDLLVASLDDMCAFWVQTALSSDHADSGGIDTARNAFSAVAGALLQHFEVVPPQSATAAALRILQGFSRYMASSVESPLQLSFLSASNEFLCRLIQSLEEKFGTTLQLETDAMNECGATLLECACFFVEIAVCMLCSRQAMVSIVVGRFSAESRASRKTAIDAAVKSGVLHATWLVSSGSALCADGSAVVSHLKSIITTLSRHGVLVAAVQSAPATALQPESSGEEPSSIFSFLLGLVAASPALAIVPYNGVREQLRLESLKRRIPNTLLIRLVDLSSQYDPADTVSGTDAGVCAYLASVVAAFLVSPSVDDTSDDASTGNCCIDEVSAVPLMGFIATPEFRRALRSSADLDSEPHSEVTRFLAFASQLLGSFLDGHEEQRQNVQQELEAARQEILRLREAKSHVPPAGTHRTADYYEADADGIESCIETPLRLQDLGVLSAVTSPQSHMDPSAPNTADTSMVNTTVPFVLEDRITRNAISESNVAETPSKQERVRTFDPAQIRFPPRASDAEISPAQVRELFDLYTIFHVTPESHPRTARFWNWLNQGAPASSSFDQNFNSAFSEELGRMQRYKRCVLDVMTAVEKREKSVESLRSVVMKFDRQPRFYRAALCDAVLTEHFESIRAQSIAVRDAVYRWRQTFPRSDRDQPFMYKNVDYLKKMKCDLTFVLHSGLGHLVALDLNDNVVLAPRRRASLTPATETQVRQRNFYARLALPLHTTPISRSAGALSGGKVSKMVFSAEKQRKSNSWFAEATAEPYHVDQPVAPSRLSPSKSAVNSPKGPLGRFIVQSGLLGDRASSAHSLRDSLRESTSSPSMVRRTSHYFIRERRRSSVAFKGKKPKVPRTAFEDDNLRIETVMSRGPYVVRYLFWMSRMLAVIKKLVISARRTIAARKIQRWFRGYCRFTSNLEIGPTAAFEAFLAKRTAAARVIQRVFGSFMGRKKWREEKPLRRAARKIQHFWRHTTEARKLRIGVKMCQGARRIQRYYKMRLAVIAYRQLRTEYRATLLLQRCGRAYSSNLLMWEVLRRRNATLLLQRVIRGSLGRNQTRTLRHAAFIKRFCYWQSTSRRVRELLLRRCAAFRIVMCYRLHFAKNRRLLLSQRRAAELNVYMEIDLESAFRQCAALIIAVYRGYCARRSFPRIDSNVGRGSQSFVPVVDRVLQRSPPLCFAQQQEELTDSLVQQYAPLVVRLQRSWRRYAAVLRCRRLRMAQEIRRRCFVAWKRRLQFRRAVGHKAKLKFLHLLRRSQQRRLQNEIRENTRREAAATAIQSIWRGFITHEAFCQARMEFREQVQIKEAFLYEQFIDGQARVVQYYMRLNRRLSILRRARRAAAAWFLQMQWRHTLAARRTAALLKEQYRREVEAALKIQMAWRIYASERDEDEAPYNT